MSRWSRALRLFVALVGLTCGTAAVSEPLAAAPSAYSSALVLAREGTRSESARAAAPITRELAPSHPPLSAAGTKAPGSRPPALARAPRLYLRHCALLR